MNAQIESVMVTSTSDGGTMSYKNRKSLRAEMELAFADALVKVIPDGKLVVRVLEQYLVELNRET
jgi:hypothetical protein